MQLTAEQALGRCGWTVLSSKSYNFRPIKVPCTLGATCACVRHPNFPVNLPHHLLTHFCDRLRHESATLPILGWCFMPAAVELVLSMGNGSVSSQHDLP